MSAHELDPIATQFADSSPDFGLIAGQAPEGAFFESGLDFVDSELKWPPISFKLRSEDNPTQNTSIDFISENNIFGSPMGTHPENRLRSAVRTLCELVPGLIELPVLTESEQAKGKKPPTIVDAYKDTIRKLDMFLNKPTKVQGIITARRNLVTKADLMSEYAKEYRRTEHPVFQLIEEIALRNEARKAENEATPRDAVRVLSHSEIELLYDDLIIVAERPRIIKRAEQELAKKPIQLAALLAIRHTHQPNEL